MAPFLQELTHHDAWLAVTSPQTAEIICEISTDAGDNT